VFRHLVPETVATAVLRADVDPGELCEEERVQIAAAAPRRQAEFASARWCARSALAGLGIPPAPLPRGRNGEPRWPSGVTGSITHCTGLRAAAVARQEHWRSLGIDAEVCAPTSSRVALAITHPVEREELADLAARVPAVAWDRLIFSAKESVFKAWFPLTGTVIGFLDAVVHLRVEDAPTSARPPEIAPDGGSGTPDGDPGPDRPSPAESLFLTPVGSLTSGHGAPGTGSPVEVSGTFLAELDAERRRGHDVPAQMAGRWLLADGLLLTAVTVPQR